MIEPDSKAIAALRTEFERHISNDGFWPRAKERSPDGDYIVMSSNIAWVQWVSAFGAMMDLGWLNVPD